MSRRRRDKKFVVSSPILDSGQRIDVIQNYRINAFTVNVYINLTSIVYFSYLESIFETESNIKLMSLGSKVTDTISDTENSQAP